MKEKICIKKRHHLYRVAGLLFVAGLLVSGSCDGDQKTVPPEPEPEPEPELVLPESTYPTPIPLKGTTWKLAGFVDMKTGKLTELEPKDCAECYTLTFDTDYTAIGKSESEFVMIDLLDLDKYSLLTTIGELYDGDRFRYSMTSIESFTVTSEELKLYYYSNVATHTIAYLFFKPVEP